MISNHHFDDDTRRMAYYAATSYGPLQCGKFCVLERRCVSINYHMVSLTCELVEASSGDVSDSAGWVSTSDFMFVSDKLGSCANVDNQEVDVCVPLRNGGQTSMKKYCPALVVLHGNVTSRARTLGDTVTYTCNDGYYSLEHADVTCLENGQWSPPNISCIPVYENAIRLLDGPSQYEGRVQIYHSGSWGTVCDHNWDVQDAVVVCRQLGYSGGNAALGQPSSGQIWLHLVGCVGTESILADCPGDSWSDPHCVNLPSDGAGVACDP